MIAEKLNFESNECLLKAHAKYSVSFQKAVSNC